MCFEEHDKLHYYVHEAGQMTTKQSEHSGRLSKGSACSPPLVL